MIIQSQLPLLFYPKAAVAERELLIVLLARCYPLCFIPNFYPAEDHVACYNAHQSTASIMLLYYSCYDWYL